MSSTMHFLFVIQLNYLQAALSNSQIRDQAPDMTVLLDFQSKGLLISQEQDEAYEAVLTPGLYSCCQQNAQA